MYMLSVTIVRAFTAFALQRRAMDLLATFRCPRGPSAAPLRGLVLTRNDLVTAWGPGAESCQRSPG